MFACVRRVSGGVAAVAKQGCRTGRFPGRQLTSVAITADPLASLAARVGQLAGRVATASDPRLNDARSA